MFHLRAALAALIFTCSALATADAVGPAGADAPAADDEELLDEGFKSFGYLTGLARGCVVEEQQVELEREALDLNGSIGRLFGTDRAFLFAAAFGYGTSVEVEDDDCVEVIRRYDARVAGFRAGRGGKG